MGNRLFLYQDNNALAAPGVVLTPSHTLPSDVILPPLASRASGADGASNALPAIAGPYTGAADATLEVAIVDTDVSDENLVTTPIKLGVGNSRLKHITASGLAAQRFTVELVDLGDVATPATVSLDTVLIRTVAVGDEQNLWEVNVDRTNSGGALGPLTFTDTTFSLLQDIPAGTAKLAGPGYDWNTVMRSPDGNVPDTARRVAFGENQNDVYVQWKEVVNGALVYRTDPDIRKAIPKGTLIRFVTGAVRVTLSHPTLGNYAFPDIVTRYDLAKAIKENAPEFTVVTPFIKDRKPGGIALRDVLLRTDARAIDNEGTGSRHATGFKDIVIGSNANTELVLATCQAIDALTNTEAAVGHEQWALEGSVSGALGVLYSGDRYSHPAGKFAMTIPQKLPPEFGNTPRGKIRAEVVTQGESPKIVCIDPLLAGAAATAETYTFRYTARPTGDCNCEDKPYPGSLSGECLGLDIEEDSKMLNDFRYGDRLLALNRWRQAYMASQTSFAGNYALHSDKHDIQLCQLTYNAFYDGLRRIFEDSDTDLGDGYRAYTGNTAYTAGDTVQSGDFYYRVNTGGTTSASPAALTTTIGATTTDNGVVFECLDRLPLASFDVYFGSMQTDLAHFDGVGMSFHIVPYRETLNNVALNYPVNSLVDAGNGHYYKLIYVSGTAGQGESWGTPTWPTNGGTVSQFTTGGSFSEERIWLDMGEYAGNAIQETPDTVIGANNLGDITPTKHSISYDVATWTGRYIAQMNHVIAAARLDPKKADASTVVGGKCWRDPGDAFYWENVDGDLLPAFNNSEYYSSKKIRVDGKEKVVETLQFGLFLNVPCVELLQEGDEFAIIMDGVTQPATYQVGDRLLLSMVAAHAEQFAGGATGDNIQTWVVEGSDVGKLASFNVDPNNPTPYADAGLAFEFERGGIADSKGSQFAFAVVGGHFRTRVVPAAFGAPQPISATPYALGNGLFLNWDIGAFPAFNTGDTFTVRVQQPHSAQHVISPAKRTAWKWGDTATVTLLIDLLSPHTVDTVALAHQALPAVTVAAGTTPDTSDFSHVVTAHPGVLFASLPTPQTYRYWKLTFTTANDLSLAHVFLGTALTTEHKPSLALNHQFFSDRAGDYNTVYKFRALTKQYTIEWLTQAWNSGGIGYPLLETDFTNVINMLTYLRMNDNLPFMLVPNDLEADAVIGQLITDSIDIPETYQHRQTRDNSIYGLSFGMQEVV